MRTHKHIGNVGVDSGEVMICDSKTKFRGVTSRTAYGDGVYPVLQVFEDGKLVGLYVNFKECTGEELGIKDGMVVLGNL